MRRAKLWIALAAACIGSSGCFTFQVYSWPAPGEPCATEADEDWVVDRYREAELAQAGRVPGELDQRTERLIASAVYCREAHEELR